MGDEFDQYKRTAEAAKAVPGDDDEFAAYRRDPNAEQHLMSTHFAPGSAGEKAQYEYQHRNTGPSPTFNSNPFAGIISGKDFTNDVLKRGYNAARRIFPRAMAEPSEGLEGPLPGGPHPMDNAYEKMKTGVARGPSNYELLTDSPAVVGARHGIAGLTTDLGDQGASYTSPANMVLLGAGAGSKAVPALKLLTAGAGTGFGIAGAHDIYSALGDKEGEPEQTFLEKLQDPDRLQKVLLGGAQIAGGAAGIGESSPRGAFNKRMDIASPHEPFTLRELLQGARDHGINLDLADASGAGTPKMVKHATMHGLAGSGPFEANLEHNVGALDQWGKNYLDRLSKFSGENAGARIQDALKNDYAQRKNAASTEFQDLDKRVGPNTIDGTQTVEAEAVKIRDGMKPYYDKHPELVPKEAWKIINDLAERPTVASTKTVTGAGFGQPQNKVQIQVPAKSNNFSWSELHQLRSDLMDIYRNNPDLVKSRADAWLQQMVKTIDDTMTGAASQLSQADKWQFRQANETWEGLKQTYDNPQHPLYHAVRAQQPSQVTNMLLNLKAPEFARQMRGVLGPEFGDLQRAAAEDILGNDRTGAGYDFKNMPGRLKKYDPAYLHDLFGPQGARDLSMMSRTGMTVTRDINASGSGKLLQKAGALNRMFEAATGSIGGVGAYAGHPEALAVPAIHMGLERGAAHAINSPRVVDYLTDSRTARAMPRGLPIAGAANAMTPDQEMQRQVMEMIRRRPMAAPQ